MREETFVWIKNATYWEMTQEAIAQNDALCDKRERRAGEKWREYRRRIDSEYQNKPSLSSMLGRSREGGLLVECGRFLEVWVAQEKFHTGNCVPGQKASREVSEGEKETQEGIAARVNHRARKRIRRIVNANDFRAMHTLTIAPPSPENNKKYITVPYEKQRDYNYVRGLLKEFLRRCRRADVPITYLAVFELHDSERTSPEKRGTWHIHLATNTDEQVKWAVQDLWWYGRTDYQDYRYDKQGKERDETVSNPGAYMAEYIGKGGAQFGEKNLINKRRYTTSRDVIKPAQQALSSVDIGGDFDTIKYRGKYYKNVFYSSKEVPGTNKISITATYQEIEK